MTTYKIAEALGNPEPAPDPLPEDLAALPATIPELTSLAGFADTVARRITESIQDVEEATQRARATAVDRLVQMSSLSREQRDRVAAEETAKARREALAASEKTRYDSLRELQAVARRITERAPVLQSALHRGRAAGQVADYRDGDYLLCIGNPVLIGWAVALAADVNGGRVACLQWSGRHQEVPAGPRRAVGRGLSCHCVPMVRSSAPSQTRRLPGAVCASRPPRASIGGRREA